MRKRLKINQDFKNSTGLWLKTYTVKGNPSTEYTTKAGVAWGSLTARCNTNGKYSERFKTYVHCENGFGDFQEFAEWCQTQEGYFQLEGSRPWCLDKDILIPGNKIYSPQTCCFVPSFINSLFANKAKPRKYDLPLGVTSWGNKFLARCNTQEGRINIGIFTEAHEAHKAWQMCKIEHIKNVAEQYLYLHGSREDVYTAICTRASKIEIDSLRNVQTVFI